MASKVQICNRALARLGAARITSLTDNTNEARLCNLLYDDVVDEVIVEGSWARAIRRASLNATDDTPLFDYAYEFQLPTNPVCLRVLSISELKPGAEEYRVEGDKLLADISTVSVRYLARLTDPNDFGVHLTAAIMNKLTAEMAYTITGQAQIAARWADTYRNELGIQLALDGQQGSTEVIHSDDLIDVR